MGILDRFLPKKSTAKAADPVAALEAALEAIRTERDRQTGKLEAHGGTRRALLHSDAATDEIVEHDVSASRAHVEIERLEAAESEIFERIGFEEDCRADAEWREYVSVWIKLATAARDAIDAAQEKTRAFHAHHSLASGAWTKAVELERLPVCHEGGLHALESIVEKEMARRQRWDAYASAKRAEWGA